MFLNALHMCAQRLSGGTFAITGKRAGWSLSEFLSAVAERIVPLVRLHATACEIISDSSTEVRPVPAVSDRGGSERNFRRKSHFELLSRVRSMRIDL